MDKVAGRQVQIGLIRWVTRKPRWFRALVISAFVLKVQVDGEELTPEESIVATTVTLEGDRMVDEEGGVLINGDKVANEASGLRGLRVEIEPDASRFPTMGLKVYPRNADALLKASHPDCHC